jgi:O-antigen ligase
VRAPVIHAGPVWGPRLQTALVFGGSAVLAMAVGAEIGMGSPEQLTKPVLALAALAGAIVLFSIPPEKLFLGSLFFAPLFQNSADESAVGRPLSFAFYLAPPAILACQTLWHWRRRSDASFVDVLPALLVGYVLVSAVLTSELYQASPVSVVKEVFQVTAIGVVFYYFIVFGPGVTMSATSIVRVLFASAAIQAFLSLVEWQSGWSLWGPSWWQTVDPPRSAATLVSPGVLGLFLGCAIVAALAVISWGGPRQLRRASWLVLAISLPGLLVTYTRGPIAATAIAGLGVLVLGRRGRTLTIGAIAAVVLALVALWTPLTQSELYQQRVADRTNVAGREDIQDVSLRAAAKKPVVGWGYGSFERAKVASSEGFTARVEGSLETTSHNGFLTILVEFGGVGLALLLLPWAVVLSRGVGLVRRGTSEPWFIVACIAAVVVFGLTMNTTDLKFFSLAQALPWLFIGLIRRAHSEVGVTSTS